MAECPNDTFDVIAESKQRCQILNRVTHPITCPKELEPMGKPESTNVHQIDISSQNLEEIQEIFGQMNPIECDAGTAFISFSVHVNLWCET